MRHAFTLAVLFAVALVAAPAHVVLAQTPVALVPAPDSIAGDWILSGAELVTVTISVNGAIAGTYIGRDMADGAADRYAVAGNFDGRELRLLIVGTCHPGYVLRRTAPDTFTGSLTGIPGEVTFYRRLTFTGQDPV